MTLKQNFETLGVEEVLDKTCRKIANNQVYCKTADLKIL